MSFFNYFYSRYFIIRMILIFTLQDNYMNLLARDNSDIITRAMPLKGIEVKNSIMAEHGWWRQPSLILCWMDRPFSFRRSSVPLSSKKVRPRSGMKKTGMPRPLLPDCASQRINEQFKRG